jgi:hypothetical protein
MDDMLGEDKFRAEQNLLAMEEDESIQKINNPVTKQVAIALKGLAKRTQAKEMIFTSKL